MGGEGGKRGRDWSVTGERDLSQGTINDEIESHSSHRLGGRIHKRRKNSRSDFPPTEPTDC